MNAMAVSATAWARARSKPAAMVFWRSITAEPSAGATTATTAATISRRR
jgi:hypothetical protein